MKATILTNTPIRGKFLDELKGYVDWDIKVVSTTDKLPVKFNPYFNTNWGDFDWIRSQITTGDIKCFCTTHKELKEVGINGHIGMYDKVDGDSKHDFYIGLPVKLDKRAIANGFENNLAWLVIHEFLHDAEEQNGGPDRTHEMEKQGRLKELLKEHQGKYQKQLFITLLLNKIKKLLKKKPTKPLNLIHPVELYKDIISQSYGAPNSKWYPKTGHHIGTDYACPVGTKVVAPFKGEVTVSGHSNALGNYCHYQYIYDNVTYMARFMHLIHIPLVAKYARGEMLELSGESGNTTGPHLHIDVWIGEVRLDIINKKNWREKTVDPCTHFRLDK